jgi:dTDP-4-dehydrorhamnose 3,5-epimerase
MPYLETYISDVWIREPIIHNDVRGSFFEVFNGPELANTLGVEFQIHQVNQSVSRKGVLRGIHLTIGSHGQAKHVSCTQGVIIDFAIDLRLESQTFGLILSQELSASNGRSLLIGPGIGHAFLAVSDSATVNYLCDTDFKPELDVQVSGFDPQFVDAIKHEGSKFGVDSYILSVQDESAMSFSEFSNSGFQLPTRKFA